MEDHETIRYLVNTEPLRRRAADDGRETEGDETDEAHDEQNYADQTHLFSPCSLLGLGSLPTAFQHEIGTPKRNDGAVDIPEAGRADLFLRLWLLFGGLGDFAGLVARDAPGAGVRAFLLITTASTTLLPAALPPGRRGVRLAVQGVGAAAPRVISRGLDILDNRVVPGGRGNGVHVGGMFPVIIIGMVLVDTVPLRPDQAPLPLERLVARGGRVFSCRG